jgi:hypothetical protein
MKMLETFYDMKKSKNALRDENEEKFLSTIRFSALPQDYHR